MRSMLHSPFDLHSFIAQMIVGAVSPNEGTVVVLSQRQQRLDRLAIIRRNITNQRLARQHQQRQRQQQVRDQNRERCRSRADLSPERLEFRQQQDREQHTYHPHLQKPERSSFHKCKAAFPKYKGRE